MGIDVQKLPWARRATKWSKIFRILFLVLLTFFTVWFAGLGTRGISQDVKITFAKIMCTAMAGCILIRALLCFFFLAQFTLQGFMSYMLLIGLEVALLISGGEEVMVVAIIALVITFAALYLVLLKAELAAEEALSSDDPPRE